MPSDSTPVVFLPGTLCDERIWIPVWKQLPEIDRRYVPLQWATSLNDMIALTDDRVGDREKVHLVGYSMGGYIATHFACDNPERVASLTLIGYDPAGLSATELSRRAQLAKQLQSAKFNPKSEQFIAHFVHPENRQNNEVVSILTAMAEDLGVATLNVQSHATTNRPSMIAKLASSAFPVFVLGASNDSVAPSRELLQSIEQIKAESYCIIEGSGHLLPLEKSSEVATTLAKWIML